MKFLILAVGIVLLSVLIFFGVLWTVLLLYSDIAFPERFLITLVATIGILSSLGILLAVLKKMWDRY